MMEQEEEEMNYVNYKKCISGEDISATEEEDGENHEEEDKDEGEDSDFDDVEGMC